MDCKACLWLEGGWNVLWMQGQGLGGELGLEARGGNNLFQ
jgi:hypothetical protein